MMNHFNVAIEEPVNPAVVGLNLCGDWSPFVSSDDEDDYDDEDDWDDDEDEDEPAVTV